MPTSIYCNISGYTMDEVDPLMEYPYVRLIRNASELSENGIYADYPADFFDKYGIIMVAFPDKSGNTAYGIRQICKRSGGKVAVYAERSQAQDLGEKTWYFLIEYSLEDAEPQSELDISVYFNDTITAKPADPTHAKR